MDLTICTVSYQSASLLDLNLTLTSKLNPAARYRWLVVDNHDDFLHEAAHDFQLIKGDPCVNQGKLRGSYHHAQALNKALNYASTRYLLALDPDFFILRENWIEDVLAHMDKNDLSFWGAPYYPDLNWKRRYFPTVSCMLIDLKKVARAELDFTPELDEYHLLFGRSTLTLLGILMGRIPPQVREVRRAVLTDIAAVILRNRWIASPLSKLFPQRIYPNTNVSRDTGFKIQNSFGKVRRHRVETLKPSYENDLFTKKNSFLMNLLARMYFLLVPENLSIYPKRRDYTTRKRFRDFGLFDARGELGWEEFFWKDEPFAMHIKGGTRKFEDVGYEKFREILFQLAGNNPARTWRSPLALARHIVPEAKRSGRASVTPELRQRAQTARTNEWIKDSTCEN
jgi:glycosyltransferase involved in cell wall biosynthesis